MEIGEKTLERQIAEYIENLSSQDVSDNTMAFYQRDLEKLMAYLRERGVMDCKDITEQHLSGYMRHMKEEGKGPATIARATAAVRAWSRYMVQTGVLSKDPSIRLKAPSIEKKIPRILTPEEVVRLLKQPKGDTPKAVRDRAMLELLYATGIRVSELLRLSVEDVNLSLEYILCQSGRRERVIPFGKTAKRSLQAYLDTARPLLVPDPECRWLFTNLSGQQMSRQGFWKLLKQYGKEAGIRGEITPHTIRHSFAAHLVDNGADLYAVQEMMGYAGLSSTQVYAKMNPVPIREVYTRTHPRDN